MNPPTHKPSGHAGGGDVTHCRRGPARGFSLIELLLVMSIMAVLAAIAAPRYASAVSRYRLDGAAQRLAADLGAARALAKAKSAAQTVVFTTASAQYQVTGLENQDRPGAAYIVVLSGDPYGVTMKSADFGGASQVVFNGFGLPTAGGSVVLAGVNGQRQIVVNGATGAVEIK